MACDNWRDRIEACVVDGLLTLDQARCCKVRVRILKADPQVRCAHPLIRIVYRSIAHKELQNCFWLGQRRADFLTATISHDICASCVDH